MGFGTWSVRRLYGTASARREMHEGERSFGIEATGSR
jgi:hypothetical protein